MHKPAVSPLVYARLFPAPKPTDPTTFQAHITRNLVPEVRAETVCFYGPIDSLEAQYPGLDYANPAHRIRLGRYPWHRRLFRAFDDLRLTDHEIRILCRWEGTRWARERYEKDEGVKIRDTAWDDVEKILPMAATAVRTQLRGGEDGDSVFEEISEEEMESVEDDEEMEDTQGEADEEEEQESEDELQHSVGVELNQRLLAATEARARGEEAVLDADWEQWLKEATERGSIPDIPGLAQAGSSREATSSVTQYTPQWGQVIPEVFRYPPGTLPPPNVAALQGRPPPPPFQPQVNPTPALEAVLEDTPSAPPARTPS